MDDSWKHYAVKEVTKVNTLYDSIYKKSSDKANLEAESRSVITRILGAGEMVYKCQTNRYRAFFRGGRGGQIELPSEQLCEYTNKKTTG